MKKCYFAVVSALITFSPLAFSMQRIEMDSNFEGQERAVPAIDNEGYFGSGVQNAVNRYGQVIDRFAEAPAYVVDGCVKIIDNVVGTPTDVFNGCCVLLNGAQNVVNGCVEIIDNTVGTPSDVFNGCCVLIKNNPGLVIAGVVSMLVGPAAAVKGAINCTCPSCTCACRNGNQGYTIGKATDILMCSQVCNLTGSTIYSCK